MHTDTTAPPAHTASPLPALLQGPTTATLTDSERCDKLRGIIGDLLITLRTVGERTRSDAVAETAIRTATERTGRQLERLGYARPR